MTRKILAVLLLMCLSAGCVSAAAGFSDVSETNWAAEYIEIAKDNGIIDGYAKSDGTAYFLPDTGVSKQECITMLYRTLNKAGQIALEEEIDESSSEGAAAYSYIAPYEQVLLSMGIDSWAKPYCAWAIERGILSASDMMIGPNDPVSEGRTGGKAFASRQMIAKWTALAMNYELSPISVLFYADSTEIDEANQPYVDALFRNGIMQGGSTGFSGRKGVRRSEMAAICTRLLGLDPGSAGIQLSGPELSLCGVISVYSGYPQSFCVNNSSGVKSFYIPKDTTIYLDGAVASFDQVRALGGKNVVVSCYAGRGLGVMIQTAPLVIKAKLLSESEQNGRKLLRMHIEGAPEGSDDICLIADDNSQIISALKQNRVYELIADGLTILEMR